LVPGNIINLSSVWNFFIRFRHTSSISFFKLIYFWNYPRFICFCRIAEIWSIFRKYCVVDYVLAGTVWMYLLPS
jgi:hypothetical protein